ncbi:hypothetical protein AKJ45_02195 [candidate division MSBL1 archaeon SCGC-AAA261F19]|uniref:Uncharacterized protein n=1 Tax=candidate division MSBL1 archaeon SCGC-AAA261F19 TaxID=1698275 RepID=A0A133V9S2_9EURY|nr:hypothetical protein AKJ45_02195 [candidate division MSBL1 archaeon SCGC-AAA261F19]
MTRANPPVGSFFPLEKFLENSKIRNSFSGRISSIRALEIPPRAISWMENPRKVENFNYLRRYWIVIKL